MNETQNDTKTIVPTTEAQNQSVPAEDEVLLKIQQQKWIDFCAVGGLITHDDGSLKPMTITEFAPLIGVGRKTLYRWKETIPDFKARVKKRRLELGSDSRLQKVYNGLYLKASQGVPEAVKLYLQIFDGWKPPAQAHEIEHKGLGDLVNTARNKNIIEAEVVSDGHLPGTSTPTN